MSEKQTSQKIVTKYDRKVQQKAEAAAKAKKENIKSSLIAIALVVVAVIGLVMIPINRNKALKEAYITVGEYEITLPEFDYYYSVVYNDYLSTYGTYLSYFGIDITQDFSGESYNENMTWGDFFKQLAVENILQTKALLDAGKAAGFEYDTTEEYKVFKATIDASAALQGISSSAYYTSAFGKYATEERIKTYVEESYYAMAYFAAVTEENVPTSDEIKAFYQENKDNYDSVDYFITEVAAKLEKEIVTNDDGSESVVEPTAEQVAEAMAAAKKEAEDALALIAHAGTEKKGQIKSATSSLYSAWLFDAARVQGDTTIVEDTTNNKYYVLQFNDRYLDDTLTANLRLISADEDITEIVMTAFEEKGSTEEAFATLVPTYSEDSYTVSNGGLYEELTPTSMEGSALYDWIFSGDRKSGDVTSITEEGITFVMYYVSDGRPEWEVAIEEEMITRIMEEYVAGLTEKYEISDPKGRLVYLTLEAE